MIIDIYSKVLDALSKKPFRLWGISLLSCLLVVVGDSLVVTIPAVGIAITWLLTTAMSMIFLRGYLGEEVKCTQLFECFKNWHIVKRVLGGIGWSTLWVFIWSLIPVVGPIFGIIRAYEYRLVPFILMNEPDVEIMESREVSKQRTKGYKGKMFLADILWVVIVIIGIVIIGLLGKIPLIGWMFILADVFIVIAVLAFGSLFSGLISSAFYVEINKKTPNAPYYEEPADNKADKYCPQCGASMKLSDIFCPSCGIRVEPEKNEPVNESSDSVKEEQ